MTPQKDKKGVNTIIIPQKELIKHRTPHKPTKKHRDKTKYSRKGKQKWDPRKEDY